MVQSHLQFTQLLPLHGQLYKPFLALEFFRNAQEWQ